MIRIITVKQTFFLQVLYSILCYVIRLTGVIPFNGSSYKQIVLKNMKGIVNFDFSKYNVKISDESKLMSNGPVETNA